jgi:hypothetical protein
MAGAAGHHNGIHGPPRSGSGSLDCPRARPNKGIYPVSGCRSLPEANAGDALTLFFCGDVLLGHRLDQIPAGPSEEVDLVRLR